MESTLRTRRPTPDPAAIAALFSAQRALATPAQLRTRGSSLEYERVRIERGEWEWFAPGVIGLCGAPDDWYRLPMAMTLGSPHAALTGPAGLRLRGIDGFTDEEMLLAVTHPNHHPRLPDSFQLWRSRRLIDGDVMVVDGIRTTILPTALVHTAPLVDGDRFGRAVDDALRRGASPAWMQRVALRWRGQGVPGSSILSAALAERCDQRIPRSWFERVAQRALAAHGVVLEHEIPVYDDGRLLAVVDLGLEHLKVGLECQSHAWHATPTAIRRDNRRKQRLTDLGWDITDLWFGEHLHQADYYAGRIIRAIERQRKLLDL